MHGIGVHNTVVARVRAEVDRQGMALHALAVASSIPETRIQAIFDGDAAEITLRELAGLSLALGVTVITLLTPL